MRRVSLPLLAVVAAGCVKPIPQPEPERLTTPLAPANVVQAAANALVATGFEIVNSDVEGGILTARRVRGPKGNAELLTCNFAKGSISDTHMRSTITVTLTARPNGSGSEVIASTRTLAQFPTLEGGLLALPDSEDTCASNGTVERVVLSAIGAGAS